VLKNIFVTEEELIDRFTGQELWLWGYGFAGTLGTNTIINRPSPVQTISGGTNWRQVSLGGVHSAAIKTDGSLWLWGVSYWGQLGNNLRLTQSSPVQTVSGGTNWRQVSLGGVHSAAIKTDGSLWLWGEGNDGRLGENILIRRSSPVQTISSGTNWRQVSLGPYHSAAIKTDGSLWLWGLGTCGRLGDNSTISKSSPVQTVSAGNNWKQVSLSYGHSAAIKTDGTLWLWGYNGTGVLGTNSLTNQSSPVQTVSTGDNWKQVSLGRFHSAAIKTDGSLWSWGLGAYGVLGTNSTTGQSSPVQTISGGNNWKQVSLKCFNSAAIKTDGSLWMWGDNRCGQLGNNLTISQSSPVQTVSGGNSWRQVDLGNRHSAATCVIEF